MKKLYILLFVCLLLFCACNNGAAPISIDTSLAPKSAVSTPAPVPPATPLIPNQKPPYRIACIFPRNDTPEWQLAYESCASAIEALSALDVSGYCASPTTPNSTQEQIALIESAIKDGVDGILLSPTNPIELGEYITQNFTPDSHAFVISFGQKLVTNSPYVVSHIGTDMYASGKDMAKLTIEALGSNATYAIIGNEATDNTEVSRGIKDHLSTQGKYSISTDVLQSTNLDAVLSYIDSLDANPLQEKTALLITDASFIAPITSKVAASKNKDAFCIIGYGISKEIISFIESGHIYGIVGENNYLLGFDAPFYLIDFFEAKKIKTFVPIAHTVITKKLLTDETVQYYLQSIGLT